MLGRASTLPALCLGFLLFFLARLSLHFHLGATELSPPFLASAGT